MASLERRNGSWRVIFCYKRERRYFTIGEVSAAEAAVYKVSTEELLRLINRKLLSIPAGCTIEDFMFHQGKPPQDIAVAVERKELTLGELREAYFRSQEMKLEQTTLDGIRLHFDHLERILGGKSLVSLTTRADLQRYVNKRAGEWIDPEVYRRQRRAKRALAKPKRKYVRKNGPQPQPEPPERPKRHPSAATIKKEIISLRTAWNWARRQLDLAEEFPGGGLDYAKIEEALPFMTWEEAERRIAAGDDPERIWECVYLRPAEIAEMLEWVRARPVSPWVYPMFVFAAHTGARRSEMVRALASDVANGVMIIREKKRDKRKLTTRSVPLTPFLKEVLAGWIQKRGRGKTLFCKMNGKEITPREAHNYFQRGLRVSKWSVLKGWHVLRHSFISAMASRGIDQRIIDDFVGHSTEEQRRRYRHLFPDVKQQAMNLVFAPAAIPPADNAATPRG
jgi:integrase